MDTNQLLTASALDIIFDGRNKEYGAYCLRKEYNKRLKIAMLSTGIVVSLLVAMYSFRAQKEAVTFIPVTDPIELLADVAPEEKVEVIPPPPPNAPPPPMAAVQFTTPPLIAPDEEVSPDEMPPQMDDAEHARIDVFNQDGPNSDIDIVPPQGTSTGVLGAVEEMRNDEDMIYRSVEIESSYPGGIKAWARFLNKTFVYPQNAVENRIQGTVIVKFIVDINGVVSNVEAVAGPEELLQEAVRVIKKSGKWNPAIQNGRTVKSYKQQPVTFILGEE